MGICHGPVEKTEEINSRRGAENAEIICFITKNIVYSSSFAFSAPLRENRFLLL
jgi:hypothetical protein